MREEFDIQIDLSASRKLGRYGFAIRKCPLARNGAGMLNGATRDTILTFALIAALKTIPRSTTGRTANGRPWPLRVLVRCSDPTFVLACGAVNRGQRTRAAKTLWQELVNEISRFQLRFECVDESKVTTTRDFACRVLPARTFHGGFPLPMLITTES
jgi:hypothetical protein